jgi:hypothetical protein
MWNACVSTFAAVNAADAPWIAQQNRSHITSMSLKKRAMGLSKGIAKYPNG